jgi:hypothetical protein
MTWSSVRVVSHATAVITSNYEVRALNSREASVWIWSPFVLHICHILCIWYRPMLDTSIDHWQSYARLVSMWCDHLRWGVWYLYSALTTHLRCENPPVSITIYGGNWLHNSCRRQVSAWFDVYLRYVGGMWLHICFQHGSWPCIMRTIARWGGGGQGPQGGSALVYMYKYTDQEISLLTTLHIYWFTCR